MFFDSDSAVHYSHSKSTINHQMEGLTRPRKNRQSVTLLQKTGPSSVKTKLAHSFKVSQNKKADGVNVSQAIEDQRLVMTIDWCTRSSHPSRRLSSSLNTQIKTLHSGYFRLTK
jgi:hypothetical protein